MRAGRRRAPNYPTLPQAARKCPPPNASLTKNSNNISYLATWRTASCCLQSLEGSRPVLQHSGVARRPTAIHREHPVLPVRRTAARSTRSRQHAHPHFEAMVERTRAITQKRLRKGLALHLIVSDFFALLFRNPRRQVGGIARVELHQAGLTQRTAPQGAAPKLNIFAQTRLMKNYCKRSQGQLLSRAGPNDWLTTLFGTRNQTRSRRR